MTPGNPKAGETAQRILDIASQLVQTRGFNGFSYADIAVELRLTKASLHYHFPTKAELGRSLIERYEHNFVEALAGIDRVARGDFDRLTRYARIYAGVLDKQQMCLCGMLAAEHGTLPETMRVVLQHYFDVNESWLAGVLERGRDGGEFRFAGKSREVASMLLGALEGAMMLARSYGDARRFMSAAKRLLTDLRASDEAAPGTAGAATTPRRRASAARRAS